MQHIYNANTSLTRFGFSNVVAPNYCANTNTKFGFSNKRLCQTGRSASLRGSQNKSRWYQPFIDSGDEDDVSECDDGDGDDDDDDDDDDEGGKT